MRVLKTIGLIIGTYLVGIVLVAVAAEFLTWFGVNDSDFTLENFFRIATLLVVTPFFAFMASKVGCRPTDVLFFLIPFYGIFWMFRIAHRFAYLPKVDWRLGDDDD